MNRPTGARVVKPRTCFPYRRRGDGDLAAHVEGGWPSAKAGRVRESQDWELLIMLKNSSLVSLSAIFSSTMSMLSLGGS